MLTAEGGSTKRGRGAEPPEKRKKARKGTKQQKVALEAFDNMRS
jgi:hypothetical protein